MNEQKFVRVDNVFEIEKLQSQGWIITNMSSDSNNTYMVLERPIQVNPQPQHLQSINPSSQPVKKSSQNELARISKMMVTIKLTAPNADEHYRIGITKLHQYLTEGYHLDIAEAIDDILRFRLSKRIEKGNYKLMKEERKKAKESKRRGER